MADVRAEDEIFFVYDTTVLQREEDEIKDAIICFYPSVVSEQHQWELCGQLVGVLQCVQTLTDSTPNSVTLQQSKFSIRQIDKFLVVLGGARSETDGSLQRMIDALLLLFNFYHEGFKSAEKCEKRDETFKTYLQRIWDTYLPLYRSMGDSVANTLASLPHQHIPKHSSCIFLRASHLLQICSRQTGVLGGCLVFKDRILCTELCPELTSKLLVIRPKQRNFPGITVETEFRLPSGVRILTVYLTSAEVEDLQPSKPPWLQQPGASHCTFQSLYEEDESFTLGSDAASLTSPTSPSETTRSESPIVEYQRSVSTEENELKLSNSSEDPTESLGMDEHVELDANSEGRTNGANSENVDLDCDEESQLVCDKMETVMNYNSESSSFSNMKGSVKNDDADGCCGSKTSSLDGSALPIKSSTEITRNENTTSFKESSEDTQLMTADQKSSGDDLDTQSSNTPNVAMLCDSYPNLIRLSEDLPAPRCLQKSYSEERCDDAPLETFPSKSTSCTELSRQLSQDKESQTKFLFRRVKRVMSSSSGVIKNYQMLCNASVEVLSPTSPDVISYKTIHKNIDQSHTRNSSSSHSSNQSQPDIALPTTGLRVLKIEPRNSVDESTTQSNIPDSPNSTKYDIGAEANSPALSGKSLGAKSVPSHSSSDDVFRARRHSFDKVTTRLRSRRRSKKSSSTERNLEVQRTVSFKEQPALPANVILLNQIRKVSLDDVEPRNPAAPTSDNNDQTNPMIPHHLYIQGNSELLLMLILKDGQGAEAQTVNALWRSVLPQLGELDMLVKQCVDESSNQNFEAGLNFLTYDGDQRRLRGNTREPITAIQHHFCEAVTNIHEDFRKMPHLTDIKLRSHNTSIYGHRQGSQETYLQPRGMIKPPVGRPNERDASVVMETRDLHRLAKQLNHAVL